MAFGVNDKKKNLFSEEGRRHLKSKDGIKESFGLTHLRA